MPLNEPSNVLMPSDAMLKKSAENSEEISLNPPKSSVFDFLYHDVRRVGSFLSQFQAHGVVQNIKTTEGSASTGVTRSGFEANGGVPLVAQLKGGADFTATDDKREAMEQTFDPLWTHAQRLLDFLESNELIARDISKIGIGRFVLVTGALSIIDLSIMKKILGGKILKDSLLNQVAGVGSGQSSSNRDKERNQSKKTMEIGSELLGLFQMSIQASLITASAAVWCSLKEDSFSVSPGDLLLQHGPHLPGEWNILGILDATPESVADTIANSCKTFNGSEIAAGMATMANLVRPTLGRPTNAYGITPLMIFRSISG